MAKISDYLTVGEAAEFLGVSRDSLRRWDAAGKLKAKRHPVSNFRLYLQRDLDDFLAGVGVGKVHDGVRKNKPRKQVRPNE